MFIHISFYLSNSVTCKYPNPVTGPGSVYIHIYLSLFVSVYVGILVL